MASKMKNIPVPEDVHLALKYAALDRDMDLSDLAKGILQKWIDENVWNLKTDENLYWSPAIHFVKLSPTQSEIENGRKLEPTFNVKS